MQRPFKLRRLHALLAVRDAGSTLKAADIAHMTQPAVAAAVSACEGDLGQALFERTSRGMTPTQAGLSFFARAEAALNQLKQAQIMLRRSGGKAGLPLYRQVSEVQLTALTAVVESGGFSPAARRLGLSQPSVYRAAQELETLCGTALWRKRGAAIEPTAEARELARFAGLCFAELAAGAQELRELEGLMDGEVHVGTLPLASAKWLPDAMAKTLSDFPLARFHIVDGPYDEQMAALRSGRTDLLLGALRDPPPFPDIEQVHVFDDPLLIVVRADHPYAGGFDSDRDKLTPAQLASLDWILPRRGTPGRQSFDTFMINKGLEPPQHVIECGLVATTRTLLLAGDRAAVLSRQQVGPEVALGLLKVMGPPLTGSARPIGMTRRRGYRLTGLQAALWRNLHGLSAQ